MIPFAQVLCGGKRISMFIRGSVNSSAFARKPRRWQEHLRTYHHHPRRGDERIALLREWCSRRHWLDGLRREFARAMEEGLQCFRQVLSSRNCCSYHFCVWSRSLSFACCAFSQTPPKKLLIIRLLGFYFACFALANYIPYICMLNNCGNQIWFSQYICRLCFAKIGTLMAMNIQKLFVQALQNYQVRY